MTKKPHPKNPSPDFLQSHYLILTTLLVLLDKAKLRDTVKDHIRIGFAVIEILYLDRVYGLGTKSLYKPEYNAFYKCFPEHEDVREGIGVDKVIAHVRGCIRSGEVVEL